MNKRTPRRPRQLDPHTDWHAIVNASEAEQDYYALVLAYLPNVFTEAWQADPTQVAPVLHEGYIRQIPARDLAAGLLAKYLTLSSEAVA